jgi:DNA repair exonuclease SbcCD ATPase subunit
MSSDLYGDSKPAEAPKPAQIAKHLSLQHAVQEQELMQQRDARQEATQLILQFKRQLIEAAIAVDRKAESQQSRLDFLTRAVQNAEKEKDRLVGKVRQLGRENDSQKDKFEQQLETMMYQAREAEANYRAKITATLGHLRTLREFQEHKHKMDERMRQLGTMIARERKERTAELAQIHRQLVAQREYYEHQLTAKLSEADEYATKFSDLDLDRATTKILQETEHRREALKAEHTLTSEVVKRNDQLRHQVQDLEQQRQVLEESEKNLTTQAVDLKAKLQETSAKASEALEISKQRLEQLRQNMTARIGELNDKLAGAKHQTEVLKRELALAEKQTGVAEAQRDDRLRKTTNLLGVMNEAAIFILTSLELQQSDPSKDELAKHSGALNAVIRKIANVQQDWIGMQQAPTPEVVQNRSVQTELPVKKFVVSGNPQGGGAARVKPPKVSDFRKNPEYQRVFGKEPLPSGPTVPKTLKIARTGKT